MTDLPDPIRAHKDRWVPRRIPVDPETAARRKAADERRRAEIIAANQRAMVGIRHYVDWLQQHGVRPRRRVIFFGARGWPLGYHKYSETAEWPNEGWVEVHCPTFIAPDLRV